MNNSLCKLIICILLSLPFLTIHAESCDSTVLKKGLFLPPFLVDQFLSGSKTTSPLFLPIDSSTCPIINKTINLLDENRKVIGEMSIQKEWTGRYTETELTKLPNGHLAKDYELYLKTKSWHEILTTEFLLDVLFPENKYNETYQLSLVMGNIKLIPKYSSTWSRFSYTNKHWAAKNIEYQDLLEFYKSQKHFIIQIPQLSNGENTFVVPKVSYHFKTILEKFDEMFYLQDFISLNQYNAFPEEMRSLPIIVVSNTRTTNVAYNAITLLYSQGYKNIHWFSDSALKWDNKKLWTPNIPAKDKISAESLKTLYLQKNVTLIDIRPKQAFISNHIPESISIPYETVNADRYIALMGNVPKDFRSEITPGRESYPYLPFTKFEAKSNIVIISNNTLTSDEAEMAQIMLTERGHTNVRILDGGLAAWDSFTKWQYPNLKL